MSGPFSLGFGGGPKSVTKAARFWGLRCSRVCGVLGGNPPIPGGP
jgi:hypothetical protein